MTKALSTTGGVSVPSLPAQLGLDREVIRLDTLIAEWVQNADAELVPLLRWQLISSSKHFRTVALMACHYATTTKVISPRILRSAVALEMVHNVSLIIDDILDRSRYRRGRLSLHCRFGKLPAMMASGYIFAGATRLVVNDPFAVGLLGHLLQRLSAAECRQWRLRKEPLGVEDWRLIAAEDTGSMFDTAARLGTRDDRLRKFGLLLGILYHGCDDVADVRGTGALGGGGAGDIRDRILTLPAAIAIRRPEFAALYRSASPAHNEALHEGFIDALPAAEAYLDQFAAEAAREARTQAEHPERLLALIERTRALSLS